MCHAGVVSQMQTCARWVSAIAPSLLLLHAAGAEEFRDNRAYPFTSSVACGEVDPMPTEPAGAESVPVMPVAKITLPTFRKLLVPAAGVSTALLVPIRMLLEPVVKVVLATLKPKTVLFAPVIPERLRALFPTTVLLEPGAVGFCIANAPTAVLFCAVWLLNKAKAPTAVLEEPLV